MNNMRRGFTLIELIFVILIIGILAAVALPKFLESAQQAHSAKVKAFVGSLNRTAGPAIWAASIEDGNLGLVATNAYCGQLYAVHFDGDLISEITGVNDACAVAVNAAETPATVTFVDGNATAAPLWTYVP